MRLPGAQSAQARKGRHAQIWLKGALWGGWGQRDPRGW